MLQHLWQWVTLVAEASGRVTSVGDMAPASGWVPSVGDMSLPCHQSGDFVILPCLVINQEIPYAFIPQHCSLILGILLGILLILDYGFQKKEILPPTRGSHYL